MDLPPDEEPEESEDTGPSMFSNRFTTSFFKKGRCRKGGPVDSDEEDNVPKYRQQQRTIPTYRAKPPPNNAAQDSETEETKPKLPGFRTAASLAGKTGGMLQKNKPTDNHRRPPAQGFNQGYYRKTAPATPSPEPEEPQHERLRGLDPKIIEMVENEIMERNPGVKWDDIAGLEFAKKTVTEAIVWPLQRPDLFTGLRSPPKGLLLFGPPGTGKTLIGKAIASEVHATFFSISASSLTSKWVGEGEKLVRTLFALACVHQPTVIFIDEIDSLLSSRNDGEMECSRRIKTEFLVQLDGASTDVNDRILIIGATNRPYELDEAVRRRLVKRLYIPLPNAVGRRQLLHTLLHQERNTLHEDDYDKIVQTTKGYSGADLRALWTEAAMLPLRDITDIATLSIDSIRPMNADDLTTATRQVKATVSSIDLDRLLIWNDEFGSFPFTKDDLDN